MTPDAVILQRYWPRVLVDKNWHHDASDETVGHVGRERFIKSLKARSQQITDVKGHNVKPAQWVSWNKAHDDHMRAEKQARALSEKMEAVEKDKEAQKRRCQKARDDVSKFEKMHEMLKRELDVIAASAASV